MKILEKLRFQKYNSLVIYPHPRGIEKENIYGPPGQVYRYKGKLVHLLIPKNGHFEAYEPLAQPSKLDPRRLGLARYCAPAMRMWRHRQTLTEKIAVWAAVAALAIGALLLFLVQGSTGG